MRAHITRLESWRANKFPQERNPTLERRIAMVLKPQDVDVITEVASVADHHRLAAELRERGLKED